ncbi:hypothetical protein [Pseudorhizobium flavum]|uniref:hypothetical protein n=1 Tax=Pseudorhizobium flavum TaxID=1335061 RepID=UPI002490EA33|nr:hypothetical protein [Pseudorhizobium flavum]
MRKYKALLLGATATAALLGASQASAFEVVDWDWTHTVTGTTNVKVDVNVANDPEGLVQVEKLQVHFGDINAESTVSGVHNSPAGSQGGPVVINEIVEMSVAYEDGSPLGTDVLETNNNNITGLTTGPSGGLTLTLVDQGGGDLGNVNEFGEAVDFDLQITGTFQAPPVSGTFDAIDLPKVENAATAVANNQSIEADVPLYLHDAQFAAGGFGDSDVSAGGALAALLAGAYIVDNDEDLEDINEHTTMAALLTVAAGAGLVQPASVTATANVSDILNAYVDNAATAVTNNASFTVESENIENHVMIADLTQWGYANVSSTASVSDVNINGYTNFGAAGLGGGLNEDIVPIVANAATAVGNNLSITVGMPDSD